jgi:putative transposase
VERLWRSVKYEEVYLYAYDSVNDAKRGLEKYFRLYNQDRPHTALDDKTPDEFYYENLPALQKAA